MQLIPVTKPIKAKLYWEKLVSQHMYVQHGVFANLLLPQTNLIKLLEPVA